MPKAARQLSLFTSGNPRDMRGRFLPTVGPERRAAFEKTTRQLTREVRRIENDAGMIFVRKHVKHKHRAGAK